MRGLFTCKYKGRGFKKLLLKEGWSHIMVVSPQFPLYFQTVAHVTGEFSSPELAFCTDSCSVSIPPYVTAVARKRPWSFCQMCRLHIILNMCALLSQ